MSASEQLPRRQQTRIVLAADEEPTPNPNGSLRDEKWRMNGRLIIEESRIRYIWRYSRRIAYQQKPTIARFPGIPKPLNKDLYHPQSEDSRFRDQLIQEARELHRKLREQENGLSSFNSFALDKAWYIWELVGQAIDDDILDDYRHWQRFR
ncbi:MAG: hypothetical protein HETSPECPRED_000544 [Heterodermia speciosa]|uniref:Uncharacterized protein n=1 Tax=Heterodermia speciosa TaxID=116794 RepID=A0A8H3G9U9_9LECA|nr:MAG: hypothetical protein HETSPECPRED_000544 [Heterodermia speciosa]